MTPEVVITYDTGNPFTVAELPNQFTKTVVPYVRHLQLKDYQLQFPHECLRRIPCTIGVGTGPFDELLERFETFDFFAILVAKGPPLDLPHGWPKTPSAASVEHHWAPVATRNRSKTCLDDV